MPAVDAEIVREPDLIAAEAEQVARAELMKITPTVTDALVLQREPNLVLAEATKAAKALMAVMNQKANKVMMNGEQYIENEDWLTIGHFYGVTAQIETDRFVTFGEVQGWEATAVLVARDGRVLGRATAMCLNDEEKWSTRPKKEWAYCLGPEDDHSKHGHSVEDPGRNLIIWRDRRPVKARIVTGEERVPLFQLRSMAQTRASSKVHASVLRFVPVLAGYKGTPAEELPDAERVSNAPEPEASPAGLSATVAGSSPVAMRSEPPAPPPSAHPPTREERETRGGAGPGETPSPTTRPDPPSGYVYIDDYEHADNGWHDVRVGRTKYSTKTAVGRIAGEAFAAGRPVKLTSRPKENSPGEHWLNSVTVWTPEADEPPF